MKNILAVIAHPDDLEMMAGGTVAKWIKENKKVFTLTFTDGSWISPEKKVIRTKYEALKEEENAANYLGYFVENLNQKTLNLKFKDEYVVEILKRIKKYDIDTIICPYENDLHHDHEVVSKLAIAASRRIPNLLMGQINYYQNKFFSPNVFVDITETWEEKINAIKLFKGQWKRSGEEWLEFLDATTKYYGKIIGVKRAEGFCSNKLLIS